jgi:hypothetical protein
MLVKKFRDGSRLEFGKGNFDDWCMHYYRASGKICYPLDSEMLKHLLKYEKKYGTVYRDFVTIYESTDKTINPYVVELITSMCSKYGDDSLRIDKLLTTFYASMIAEENKEGTHLGKRVKRLGVHQVLRDGMPPEEAANYSKNVWWEVLLWECRERDF